MVKQQLLDKLRPMSDAERQLFYQRSLPAYLNMYHHRKQLLQLKQQMEARQQLAAEASQPVAAAGDAGDASWQSVGACVFSGLQFI